MSKSDFDEFVKRQQAEQEKQSDFNPKQQLEDWLRYLDDLYKQIAGYLQSYEQNGSAKIEYIDIGLNEDFIGTYIARKMVLKIGSATFTFTPIGTLLIGSKGRVDVQGPAGKARLTLVSKTVTAAQELVHVTVRRAGDPLPPRRMPEAIKQIEWTWKLITPPPDMKFIELTEEVFFDLILAVANA